MWAALNGTGLEFCVLVPCLIFSLFALAFYVDLLQNTAPKTLRNWAKENGYQLVGMQWSFFKGAFFGDTHKTWIVYRIVVYDTDGRRRNGWAGVGSSSWIVPGSVEVRWDEPPPSSPEPSTQNPQESSLWDRQLDS